MKITPEAEKEIRSFAIRNSSGYGYSSAPISIIEGKQSPKFIGEPFRWETKTGKPVYYPTAYRKAWGKPVYVHSTRAIQVGKEWIRQLHIDQIQVKLSRERGRFVGKELAEFVFNFGESN